MVCFSASQSPGPHSFIPLLSTSKRTGSVAFAGGVGTATVWARRLGVE